MSNKIKQEIDKTISPLCGIMLVISIYGRSYTQILLVDWFEAI